MKKKTALRLSWDERGTCGAEKPVHSALLHTETGAFLDIHFRSAATAMGGIVFYDMARSIFWNIWISAKTPIMINACRGFHRLPPKIKLI